MDDDDCNSSQRNEILSQSYSRGVERIAQQKDDIGGFDMPKELTQMREKAWDTLFEKYSEEMSDDVELNLRDSGSETEEQEEEDDEGEDEDDDDDDDDDDDEREFFTKCRAPIRKHPALVQYWIDTGNPPYQLASQNDHSESGSSLSEEDNSKCRTLLNNSQETANGNRNNSPSGCSSVDTAAYIRSNANVTKKPETIAIVEGSKDPVYSSLSANFDSSEEYLHSSQGEAIPGQTADACDNNNTSSDSMKADKNIGTNTETLAQESMGKSTALDNKNMDKTGQEKCCEKTSEKLLNIVFSPRSMKIKDVLPTLEQFDKIMNMKASNSEEDKASSIGENFSITLSPKVLGRKSLNRKKLYTGRNSPMDIILTSVTTDSKVRGKAELHPALVDTPSTIKVKQSYSKRRSNWLVRKKKKRFSQIPETEESKNLQNEDDKDEEPVKPQTGEDFFESLGLTPSTKSPRKRTLRRYQMAKNSAEKDIGKTQQSQLNSRNSQSSDSEDQLSEIHDEKNESNKKLNELQALCRAKKLVVCLQRIPKDYFSNLNINEPQKGPFTADGTRDNASVHITKKSNPKIKEVQNGPLDVEDTKHNASLSTISRCPSKILNLRNNRRITDVQEVDFDSLESDQSTILICECANDISTVSEQNTDTLQLDNRKLEQKKSGMKDQPIIKASTLILNEFNGRKGRQIEKKVLSVTKKSIERDSIANPVADKDKDPPSEKKDSFSNGLPTNNQSHKVKQCAKNGCVTFRSQSSSSESGSILSSRKNGSSQSNTTRSFRTARIRFSDEEDDFVKTVQRNFILYDETKTQQSDNKSISVKSGQNHSQDREDLIKDLTSEVIKKPMCITAEIVDTEDEGSSDLEKLAIQTKKENDKRQLSSSDQSKKKNEKTQPAANKGKINISWQKVSRTIVHPNKSIRQITIKNSAKKRLIYRSDSSDTSEEQIVSPPKKQKTESGAVPVISPPRSIIDDLSTTQSLNSSDKGSNNIDESILLLNGHAWPNSKEEKNQPSRVLRSTERKRKSSLSHTGEAQKQTTSRISNKSSAKSPAPSNNSRTELKDLSVSLEKIRIPPIVTMSCPTTNEVIGKIHFPVEAERYNADSAINGLKKKNIKRRRPITRKTHTIKTKKGSSVLLKRRTIKINSVLTSDSDTDDNETLVVNKSGNKIGISSCPNSNDSNHITLFPNPFNDSTEEEENLFKTIRCQNQNVDKSMRSTGSRTKFRRFRTNSDSDD